MGEKVTAGPWQVFSGPLRPPPFDTHIYAIMRGNDQVVAWGGFDASDFPEQNEANARFIVTAVNACFSINSEHPEKVAGEIEEAFRLLRRAAETPSETHAYSERCHCLRCSARALFARLKDGRKTGALNKDGTNG